MGPIIGRIGKITSRSHWAQASPPANWSSATTASSTKLLDQVRELIRLKSYSYRTQQAYVDWIKRYPSAIAKPELEIFLTDLATAGHVGSPRIRRVYALLFAADTYWNSQSLRQSPFAALAG